MKPLTFIMPYSFERRLVLNLYYNKISKKFKSHSAVSETSVKKDLDDIIGFKTTKNSSWIVEVHTIFF